MADNETQGPMPYWIGLHYEPVYISNIEAQRIVDYAATRAVILKAGIDTKNAGDLALGLVLRMLNGSGRGKQSFTAG